MRYHRSGGGVTGDSSSQRNTDGNDNGTVVLVMTALGLLALPAASVGIYISAASLELAAATAQLAAISVTAAAPYTAAAAGAGHVTYRGAIEVGQRAKPSILDVIQNARATASNIRERVSMLQQPTTNLVHSNRENQMLDNTQVEQTDSRSYSWFSRFSEQAAGAVRRLQLATAFSQYARQGTGQSPALPEIRQPASLGHLLFLSPTETRRYAEQNTDNGVVYLEINEELLESQTAWENIEQVILNRYETQAIREPSAGEEDRHNIELRDYEQTERVAAVISIVPSGNGNVRE
jgi:hypothetical protein